MHGGCQNTISLPTKGVGGSNVQHRARFWCRVVWLARIFENPKFYFFRNNFWNLPWTTNDHGSDHGPWLAKIHGPRARPWALSHKNGRSGHGPSFRYTVRTKFPLSGLGAGQKFFVRTVKISNFCHKSNLCYFFRILTSQKCLKNNFVP